MLDRLRKQPRMAKQEYLDDVHVRILRVTEDLRAIQRELNCAAMQAPSDPELMEVLTQLPELESLDVLKSALDQMRHFLWFYSQVMSNEPELGDKLRQAGAAPTSNDAAPNSGSKFMDQLSRADELMLLHHLVDARRRKPN